MKFFTAEDFENYIKAIGLSNHVAKIVADIAESKLQCDAKVVYVCDYPWQSTTLHFAQPVDATHTGLLICVEEIERKPCEHEPITYNVSDKYSTDEILAERGQCKHCGVKLKAKWEVAE